MQCVSSCLAAVGSSSLGQANFLQTSLLLLQKAPALPGKCWDFVKTKLNPRCSASLGSLSARRVHRCPDQGCTMEKLQQEEKQALSWHFPQLQKSTSEPYMGQLWGRWRQTDTLPLSDDASATGPRSLHSHLPCQAAVAWVLGFCPQPGALLAHSLGSSSKRRAALPDDVPCADSGVLLPAQLYPHVSRPFFSPPPPSPLEAAKLAPINQAWNVICCQNKRWGRGLTAG